MYAEPEKSRNPPQSYHFPLIHVATCVRVLREATSISEVSPSSHTCDNTLENLGCRAGNSHDGSTRGALGLHGVVSSSYSLTKQNKVKRSPVNRRWREVKGVDCVGPHG
jgi:hypothetical protein